MCLSVHDVLATFFKAVDVPPALQGTAIKLFRFNDEGGAGAWELHAPAVTPHFFDANEDAASAQPKWHLEADEAEAEVTDQFSLELGGRRVISVAAARSGRCCSPATRLSARSRTSTTTACLPTRTAWTTTRTTAPRRVLGCLAWAHCFLGLGRVIQHMHGLTCMFEEAKASWLTW